MSAWRSDSGKLLEHLQLLGARRLRGIDPGTGVLSGGELRRNLGAGARDRQAGHEPGEATPDRAPARDVLH